MRLISLACSFMLILAMGGFGACAGESLPAASLRQLAVKERPVDTLQGRPSLPALFNQNGDVDINALRRIIDETMADIASTNANISEDVRPLIIGSAIYLAKDDNTVSADLIEDIDIMFDRAAEKGDKVLKLREIFVKKLRERFIEIMGAGSVSEIEKGFSPNAALEVEKAAFYEFVITNHRGQKITLSFPPPAGNDAAESIWASVAETFGGVIARGEDALAQARWAAYPDKMVKRCMEAVYYLTSGTGQEKIFRGLRGVYIDTIKRGIGEQQGKRRLFITEFYKKHFLPTLWKKKLMADFSSVAGDTAEIARFKGLIKKTIYGEAAAAPAPTAFSRALAIETDV